MPCQRQAINVLNVCYNSLCLIPRNRRSKHGPQQQVFRGPNTKCWTAHNWAEVPHCTRCYLLN